MIAISLTKNFMHMAMTKLSKSQERLRLPLKSLNDVEFVVVERSGEALLGNKLGILQIKSDDNWVSRTKRLTSLYENCFQGVGKLKNFQLKYQLTKKLLLSVNQYVAFHII